MGQLFNAFFPILRMSRKENFVRREPVYTARTQSKDTISLIAWKYKSPYKIRTFFHVVRHRKKSLKNRHEDTEETKISLRNVSLFFLFSSFHSFHTFFSFLSFSLSLSLSLSLVNIFLRIVVRNRARFHVSVFHAGKHHIRGICTADH